MVKKVKARPHRVKQTKYCPNVGEHASSGTSGVMSFVPRYNLWECDSCGYIEYPKVGGGLQVQYLDGPVGMYVLKGSNEILLVNTKHNVAMDVSGQVQFKEVLEAAMRERSTRPGQKYIMIDPGNNMAYAPRIRMPIYFEPWWI